MEFIAYPKISEKITLDSSHPKEWRALEKIHGANLSLITDGVSVKAAKRKGILKEDQFTNFFNLDSIWPNLSAGALNLFKELSYQELSIHQINIYGELCGGGDISGKGGVQEGVFYSKDLTFIIFDLLIIQDNDKFWLGDKELRELSERSGFLVAPLIQSGSYQEMMRVSTTFESRLPSLLTNGKVRGNIAEGLVIKPLQRSSFERPIFKRKHSLFSEVSSAPTFKIDQKSNLPDWLIYEATLLLNHARVESAKSKLGSVKDRLIVEEALFDLLDELEERVGKLESNERGELFELLKGPAETLL